MEKKGLFSGFKKGLAKTSKMVKSGISTIFPGNGKQVVKEELENFENIY